jgi:hypothetical protein
VLYRLRQLTAEEFLALPDDVRTQLSKMAAAVKQVHEDHPCVLTTS